jgi:peptide/nickel transport system substrate-binding protein
MRNIRGSARLVAVGAVGVIALAACGSSNSSSTPGTSGSAVTTGYNAGVTSVVNPSTVTGGTLKLGESGDVDSYDPARTYYAYSWDLQRLFTRSLMGFPGEPGAGGNVVVPDLATAPPTISADGKTYTYKIYDGLKWDDGTPLTTADIKYGIERLWATDVINGGPSQYYLCLLDTCVNGTPQYKGPYADPTGGLTSIQTPDATTITFTLNKPYADFNYLMALPASAPVPKARDTKADYGKKPASSGPFMFQSFTPNSLTTWVRNPNWSQATDKIRKPMVNTVTLTVDSNQADLDQRLAAGDVDLIVDGSILTTDRAKYLSNPTLKAGVDNPATSFIRYMAVMQTVAPLTNVNCREAVFYAFDKAGYIKIRGGDTGGSVAFSMTPNGIPGFDASFNPYPNGADYSGDITAAKAALTKCGQPNGFSISMAYVNTGIGPALFASVQAALGRVGIKVTSAPADQSQYYATWIGSPQNIINKHIGIAVAAWGPDVPSVGGYWNSIANGSLILPTGNSNYPSLNDPVVNQALADATQTTDQAKQATLGTTINQQVMKNAVYLPIQTDKFFTWRPPHLTNVFINQGLGWFYDYVQVGTGGK